MIHGIAEKLPDLAEPGPSDRLKARRLETCHRTGGGDSCVEALYRYEARLRRAAGLTPAAAPTPPIWVGVGGPKGLAVTGRNADGWVPPPAADWRSTVVAESRPIIDEAAASAGRDPTDVGTIYNVAGRITQAPVPVPKTRTTMAAGSGAE
jgi:alkanesulfonate monooxygenase SsuD/methylene tetrahydromethanopterin reductase-like flavin-dependent oxidoreductase (luciferase family)